MTPRNSTHEVDRPRRRAVGRTSGRRAVDALQEIVASLEGRAPPLQSRVVRLPDEVDPRSIRRSLGLSQAAFARAFCISLDALQNWEQGRRKPDAMARAYLAVIAHDPATVRRALAR